MALDSTAYLLVNYESNPKTDSVTLLTRPLLLSYTQAFDAEMSNFFTLFNRYLSEKAKARSCK